MNAFMVELAVRSFLIAGLTLALRLALFRASAHSRANVLALGMASLIALPFTLAFLPRLPITIAQQKVYENSLGASAVETTTSGFGWGWVLVAVAALLMLRVVAALFRFRRIERSLAPASLTLVERVKEMTSKARRVFFSPEGEPPMTWGMVRPKIALPADAETWVEPQFRSIVLHEDAHIRRKDWAVSIGFRFVTAIFWFNPLVWAMRGLFEQDSERAADDWVLAQGFDAQEYAERIVEVARNLRPSGGRLPAVTMARSTRLTGRLKAILNSRTQRRPVTGWKHTALVGVLSAGALAGGFVIPKTEWVFVPSSTVASGAHVEAQDDFSTVDTANVHPAVDGNVDLADGPSGVVKTETTNQRTVVSSASHSSGGSVSVDRSGEDARDVAQDVREDVGQDMDEAMREARRSMDEAQREAERSMKEAQREADRTTKEAMKDAHKEMQEQFKQAQKEIDKAGVPINLNQIGIGADFAKKMSQASLEIAGATLKAVVGSGGGSAEVSVENGAKKTAKSGDDKH